MRSTGSSTPKSPRATMIPSEAKIISLILVSASGISIFAMIFDLLLFLSKMPLSISMSATLLTKLSAIQSNSSLIMKSRSIMSFSVKAGKEIFVSGKFNPFLEEIIPPSVTVTLTSPFASTDNTFTSIFPSSIMMVLPTTTSPARLG